MDEDNEYVVYVDNKEWASSDKREHAEEVFGHFCRKFNRATVELWRTAKFRPVERLMCREVKHA